MALDRLRRRVVKATTGLFAHAEDPLAHTLDHAGDPGLFGPESVTWTLMSDAATFVGGIRALLIQAAHPEVVAGVHDHSRYREDPLGRLSRTSNYVTATAYGAMPEVERAVEAVRRAHRPVEGTSHRGKPYTADTPELAAWVHGSLVDSFLAANQFYGATPLGDDEADAYVAEQCRVGRLLDADPLFETASELSTWIAEHPALDRSPGMVEAVRFLQSPPLPPAVATGYQVLFRAAVATVPPRIGDILGVEATRTGEVVGRRAIAGLRWALGASPRWRMALLRVGADIPEHRFKQKRPFEDLAAGTVSRSARPGRPPG